MMCISKIILVLVMKIFFCFLKESFVFVQFSFKISIKRISEVIFGTKKRFFVTKNMTFFEHLLIIFSKFYFHIFSLRFHIWSDKIHWTSQIDIFPNNFQTTTNLILRVLLKNSLPKQCLNIFQSEWNWWVVFEVRKWPFLRIWNFIRKSSVKIVQLPIVSHWLIWNHS